jgi:hypothetical protein
VTGSGQVANGSVVQTAQAFFDGISSGIPGTSYQASSVTVQINNGSAITNSSSG